LVIKKEINILDHTIDEMEEAEHFIHTEHTEDNHHDIHSTDNIEFPDIHHEIGSNKTYLIYY
jgi:hypothetical protein